MKHKANRALLRAFLLSVGMLPLLTSCNAIRNALTPRETKVFITDTIVLKEVKLDTVAITLPVDTIFLENERVSAKVIRTFDTIRIEANCKADTVTITKTVTLPTKTKIETKTPWWFTPLLIVLGVLFVIMAFKSVLRF